MSNANDVNDSFVDVASCNSHSFYSSVMVKEPVGEGPPDNFLISFSDCNFGEGKMPGEVIAGLRAFSDELAAQGDESGSWMMFPYAGVADVDFAFKGVSVSNSMEDMGKNWDHAMNGGGWAQTAEKIGALMTCDVARIYQARTLRRMSAGD